MITKMKLNKLWPNLKALFNKIMNKQYKKQNNQSNKPN